MSPPAPTGNSDSMWHQLSVLVHDNLEAGNDLPSYSNFMYIYEATTLFDHEPGVEESVLDSRLVGGHDAGPDL
ncbi:hypothetical protein VTO73DRAFT_1680 [Trametes versicolor]